MPKYHVYFFSLESTFNYSTIFKHVKMQQVVVFWGFFCCCCFGFFYSQATSATVCLTLQFYNASQAVATN